MIRVDGLCKAYDGREVVSDVCMEIASGSISAIVGTSGSGKSTLLRMINRLVEPTHGAVEIDGQDTCDIPLPALRQRIGYVIQDHGLFPHWNVVRNIATVPQLLGWPRDQVDKRVHELLLLLQLDPQEIGPRYPHQLSGGQAQRVGVARALAARPDILLMDEPFGALDPVIRAQAQSDLKRLQETLGTTIILVTHDMSEAIRLGDQIAVMRAGRLEQLAAPSEILLHPANGFVRSLIGEEERPFRYLSLIPLSNRVEPGAAEGPAISEQCSLLEALAELVWSGREALPVSNVRGEICGRITRDSLLSHGLDSA